MQDLRKKINQRMDILQAWMEVDYRTPARAHRRSPADDLADRARMQGRV